MGIRVKSNFGARKRLIEGVGRSIEAGSIESSVEMAEVVKDSMIDLLNRPGRGKHHRGLPNRSSAPGDPPRSQSGGLEDSIRVEKGARTTAKVLVDAEHAAALEYGQILNGKDHILPRPYMRPSVALARKRTREIFSKNFNKNL